MSPLFCRWFSIYHSQMADAGWWLGLATLNDCKSQLWVLRFFDLVPWCQQNHFLSKPGPGPTGPTGSGLWAGALIVLHENTIHFFKKDLQRAGNVETEVSLTTLKISEHCNLNLKNDDLNHCLKLTEVKISDSLSSYAPLGGENDHEHWWTLINQYVCRCLLYKQDFAFVAKKTDITFEGFFFREFHHKKAFSMIKSSWNFTRCVCLTASHPGWLLS